MQAIKDLVLLQLVQFLEPVNIVYVPPNALYSSSESLTYGVNRMVIVNALTFHIQMVQQLVHYLFEAAIQRPNSFNPLWMNGHKSDNTIAVTVDQTITTNGTNRFPLKNANACGSLL